MRKLVNRTVVAGLLAFLGADAMLAPPQASARAGGFVAGRADFNLGGLGRGGFRIGDVHRLGGQPLVRPGQLPPPIGGAAVIQPASGLAPLRHHRRFFGQGLPVTGIGVWSGPFYQPIVDGGTIDRAIGAGAADDRPPVRGDGVCRSETRIVPSENGGERSIRMTWCRRG